MIQLILGIIITILGITGFILVYRMRKNQISALNGNTSGKSPLEGINGIKVNITTQELVEIIREIRAGI